MIISMQKTDKKKKDFASKQFLQVKSQIISANWLLLLNNKKLHDAKNTFMKLGCLDKFFC